VTSILGLRFACHDIKKVKSGGAERMPGVTVPLYVLEKLLENLSRP
jgi:hypothetical protein